MHGIILAAGYGTRFLPVTKAVPKELFPLANRPAIDYIVQEFIDSGITDIVIVISTQKQAIRSFYTRSNDLERHLIRAGKERLVPLVRPPQASIQFVYQPHMGGTGHALLQAGKHIPNQPVVVAYPDDIHWGTPPLSQQLIQAGTTSNASVLATIHNPPNISRYGVVRLTNNTDDNTVDDVLEKPPPHALPSRYASIGRFLYQPQFFAYLHEGWDRHCTSGTSAAEYWHIYALKKLIADQKVIHHPVQGEILDVGEPSGYLQSQMRIAELLH